MSNSCLCKCCTEKILKRLVLRNEEIELQKENVSVSGSPIVEVPYTAENGNTYFKGEYAETNYCCQCGDRV